MYLHVDLAAHVAGLPTSALQLYTVPTTSSSYQICYSCCSVPVDVDLVLVLQACTL